MAAPSTERVVDGASQYSVRGADPDETPSEPAAVPDACGTVFPFGDGRFGCVGEDVGVLRMFEVDRVGNTSHVGTIAVDPWRDGVYSRYVSGQGGSVTYRLSGGSMLRFGAEGSTAVASFQSGASLSDLGYFEGTSFGDRGEVLGGYLDDPQDEQGVVLREGSTLVKKPLGSQKSFLPAVVAALAADGTGLAISGSTTEFDDDVAVVVEAGAIIATVPLGLDGDAINGIAASLHGARHYVSFGTPYLVDENGVTADDFEFPDSGNDLRGLEGSETGSIFAFSSNDIVHRRDPVDGWVESPAPDFPDDCGEYPNALRLASGAYGAFAFVQPCENGDWAVVFYR